jgi:hypothetical protein
MDYSKVIVVIENNIKNLAESWKEEVKKAKFTKTYHSLEDDEIIRRALMVFEHLVNWMKSGASNDEAEKYFENVGKDRLRQGIPLSEINYAFYLDKKIFWNFISNQKELMSNLNSSDTLEMMTLLSNYFDLGSFFLTQGYFYEFFRELDDGAVYSKDQLKDFLMKGIPEYKIIRPDEFVWRHI